MKHDLIIGKYTLESITNGMYASPLDFYREYIQNAVDSIDDAISDALEPNEEYEIAINIVLYFLLFYYFVLVYKLINIQYEKIILHKRGQNWTRFCLCISISHLGY